MASQYHNYLAGLVAEESESDYLRELFMDKKNRESKYLRFVENEEVNAGIAAGTRKTKVVTVWSKYDNIVLGEIEWYPAWRTYIFESVPEYLVFDSRCLQEILECIQDLLAERNKERGRE